MNPRHSVPQTDALPTELHPPFGTPEWTRTTDQRLRRPLLYPTELQAPRFIHPGQVSITIDTHTDRLSKNRLKSIGRGERI